jgi:hypothetical protein
MGDKIIADIVTIATAIVGLTIIAVLVSKQANTGSVITAATGGFATDLKAAVSPLSGGSGLSL